MSADALVGYDGTCGMKSRNDAIHGIAGDKQHCGSL